MRLAHTLSQPSEMSPEHMECWGLQLLAEEPKNTATVIPPPWSREDHTSASASLHFKICHNAIHLWLGTAEQWVLISARKLNGASEPVWTLRTSPSPTLQLEMGELIGVTVRCLHRTCFKSSHTWRILSHSGPLEGGGDRESLCQRPKELSLQSLWFLGKSSETCVQETSHPGI